MILTVYQNGNEVEASLADTASTETILTTLRTMASLTDETVVFNTNTPNVIDRKKYEEELAERQKNHLANMSRLNGMPLNDNNWRPCMHDQCPTCHGTGVSVYGGMCAHNIACPCPKCSPTY